KLLRELLTIEVELRAGRGENPSVEEYLGRYPQWAQAIAVVFSRNGVASHYVETGFAPALPGQAHPTSSTESGSPRSSEWGEVTVMVHWLGESRPRAGPVEPLPERFGRYAVTGLLGRGSFGRVYLARDDELGRLVAVKVPHPGRLRSPEQV